MFRLMGWMTSTFGTWGVGIIATTGLVALVLIYRRGDRAARWIFVILLGIGLVALGSGFAELRAKAQSFGLTEAAHISAVAHPGTAVFY